MLFPDLFDLLMAVVKLKLGKISKQKLRLQNRIRKRCAPHLLKTK